MEQLDKLSIITYLSQLYHKFSDQTPQPSTRDSLVHESAHERELYVAKDSGIEDSLSSSRDSSPILLSSRESTPGLTTSGETSPILVPSIETSLSMHNTRALNISSFAEVLQKFNSLSTPNLDKLPEMNKSKAKTQSIKLKSTETQTDEFSLPKQDYKASQATQTEDG